jgi:hypothetical protein
MRLPLDSLPLPHPSLLVFFSIMVPRPTTKAKPGAKTTTQPSSDPSRKKNRPAPPSQSPTPPPRPRLKPKRPRPRSLTPVPDEEEEEEDVPGFADEAPEDDDEAPEECSEADLRRDRRVANSFLDGVTKTGRKKQPDNK